MEAICVTTLTAVTGRQLAPPTHCIQMSQERPRKGGGWGGEEMEGWRGGCLGGWIRPPKSRRRRRKGAGWRLKQGSWKRDGGTAEEEEDEGGDKEGGRLEEDQQRDDLR